MEFCQLPLVPGKEVTDRKEEDEEEMKFRELLQMKFERVNGSGTF